MLKVFGNAIVLSQPGRCLYITQLRCGTAVMVSSYVCQTEAVHAKSFDTCACPTCTSLATYNYLYWGLDTSLPVKHLLHHLECET